MLKHFLNLALSFILFVWKGYVLTIIWEWFIVNTFGLPSLNLWSSLGLLTIVSYLTKQLDTVKVVTVIDDKDLEDKIWIIDTLYGVMLPLIVLFISYFIQLQM